MIHIARRKYVVATVVVAAACLFLWWSRMLIDPPICRQSSTADEFFAAITDAGVRPTCDIEQVRRRLRELQIDGVINQDAEYSFAKSECSGGVFRKRGFFLKILIRSGCVTAVTVERHDTGI